MFLSLTAFSQGNNFKLDGNNNVGVGDFLGTTNIADLVIKTNSTELFRFTSSGALNATGFSGNGSGLLKYDSDGTFLQLPYTQNQQDVLRGDGSWGSYSDGDWKVVGNNMYSIPSGNVSIGTTNPQAKLHVLGTAIITENLKVGTGTVFIGTDRFGVSNNLCTTNGPLFIQNGALCSEDIVMSAFSNSGNVGIGVFNPSEKLDVAGNVKVAGTVTAGGLDVSYTTFDSLHVQDKIKIGNSIVVAAFDYNKIYSNDGDLYIQSEPGYVYNTIINGRKDGNVGIGTDNPQKKLHVKTTTITPVGPEGSIRIEASEIDNAAPIPNIISSSIWDLEPLYDDNKNLATFSIGPPSDPVITLVENGNVGIMNTSPDAKLDLFQPDFSNRAVRVLKTTSKNYNGDILSVQKELLNAITTVFVVKDSGNVGIYTATPHARLDVNGTAHFEERVGIGTFPPPTIMLDVYAEENTTSGFRVRATNEKIAEFLWDDTNEGATRPRLQILGTPNKINLRTTYNTGGGADLTFGTSAVEDAVTIKQNGQVFVGAKTQTLGPHASSYRLAVYGKLIARQMHTTISNWSDEVFNDDYSLLQWEQQEEYFVTKGHLHGVPSEEEVMENGINLGEMDATLLRKLEESYLYIGELKTENITLNAKLRALEERVMKLEN